MLEAVIGKDILDGLYGRKNGGIITFASGVYLGLLTRLPREDGKAHEDGRHFTELSSPGYMRTRLDTNSNIDGRYIMANPVEGETMTIDGDEAATAVIRNQVQIIFSENAIEETVLGFGLFRSADVEDPTRPFAWDKVHDGDGNDFIVIGAEEVPIVREGGLEITFG